MPRFVRFLFFVPLCAVLLWSGSALADPCSTANSCAVVQHDSTANASRVIAVNADGTAIAGARQIFSYTGAASGLAAAQPAAHDLSAYREVYIQASVTAVASGTLNTTFYSDLWDVTGTSFINSAPMSPAITSAAANPSYNTTRVGIYTNGAATDAVVTASGAQGKYLGAVPFRNKILVLNTGGTAVLSDITIQVRVYGR